MGLNAKISTYLDPVARWILMGISRVIETFPDYFREQISFRFFIDTHRRALRRITEILQDYSCQCDTKPSGGRIDRGNCSW